MGFKESRARIQKRKLEWLFDSYVDPLDRTTGVLLNVI